MSEEKKLERGQNLRVTIPEVLFATLLGIAAVSTIWLSSTLLIHLVQNL